MAGDLSVTPEAIDRIAYLAASSVEGISEIRMPKVGQRLVGLLRRRGKEEDEAETVCVELSIVLDHGTDVLDVSRRVRRTVADALLLMARQPVERVDLKLVGISPPL